MGSIPYFPPYFVWLTACYVAWVAFLVWAPHRKEPGIKKLRRPVFGLWLVFTIAYAGFAWCFLEIPHANSEAADPVARPHSDCLAFNFGTGQAELPEVWKDVSNPGKLKDEPPGCFVDLQGQLQADILPEVLVLLGRVDRQEFAEGTKNPFGSNRNLAYGRAQSVLAALKGKAVEPKLLESRAIVMQAGPEYPSKELGGAHLGRDRGVEIRASWAVAKSEEEPNRWGRSDKLTLLTILIALSAYLSAVSMFLLSVAAHNEEAKASLMGLVLADFPLILGGLALSWDVFVRASDPAFVAGLHLFTFGVAGIIVLHASQWWKAKQHW